MKRKDWKALIDSLPANLSPRQAAKFLKRPEGTVRYWIARLNYRFADGRHKWSDERLARARTFDYGNVDWSMRDCQLARQYRVSRERIRQIRILLDKPKV